jgi:hypothetical protein
MDSVGTSRIHEFPQWERGALSLTVRNPEVHRCFSMAYMNCYFECDFPEDVDREIALALETGEQALKKFEINKLTRLGLAQFFTLETDRGFDDLVHRLDAKFHKPFSDLSPFQDFRLSDTAYTITINDKSGEQWSRTLQIGPMTRGEWFTRFPLDVRQFKIETQSIESYKTQIPEMFTFISIDAGYVNGTRQQLIRNTPDVARQSQRIAQDLLTYIEE